MARLPRLVVPGLPHFIVHRGHNGQPVFSEDADRELFLQALGEAVRETGVALHGYGLRPAEVRLLASPPTDRALATMMQSIGRRYVRAFNTRRGRRSSPWEGRFRSTVVEPGAALVTCLIVVEAMEGTSASGGSSPAWSSAAHHLGARHDSLITEHPVFWGLGNTPFEREIAYRRLIAEGVQQSEVARIWAAVNGGWALASREFAMSLEERSGRRTHPLPRGRPRAARS